MILLGIDPGLRFSGFGILAKSESRVCLLDYGLLKLSPTKNLQDRIHIFYDFFTEKIKKNNVTDIALETPFLGKNAQNFLKLGYLRGIIYLLAKKYHAAIHEFSPREVKCALTGFGGASKEQIERVMMQLFPRLKQQKKLDVTDALAVTLCGVWKANRNYY